MEAKIISINSEVRKTNSSSGNYCIDCIKEYSYSSGNVVLSEVIYFFKKSDALKFISEFKNS